MPRRHRSFRERVVLGVDEYEGHCSGSFEDAGSVGLSWYGVAQRDAEMLEPALCYRSRDGKVLMMLIERAPGRFAVTGWPPEPFGEELLLLAMVVRKIPAEKRSDDCVGLEAVVEGLHQPVDGGLSSNAVEQGAVF